ADVQQVARGMGLDKRIGPRFLHAGVGYGGSCFPKDVDAFVRLSDHLGYDFKLLKEVQMINKTQRDYVMKKIKQELWVVQDKRIAIFGLAFKPETDDVREAPSLYFVPKLQEMKAKLRAWDPVAEGKFKEIHPDLECVQDLYECAKDADLVLILTEWDAVKNIDLKKLKEVMACPVIVDGRNIFKPAEVRALGFTYHSVGRG
ncbi:MAG TPA: UDP binding domain-containing protein, partial [Kiritimatiellia bacterium]|nr:UDP binding domain-containing protein [Kiritimatiellia bacterium]